MKKKDDLEIKSHRELLVLKMINDASVPIGSYTLMDMLEEMGVNLSTATIGRVLSSLDKKGFVERKSFKGRVITKMGETAIKRSNNAKALDDIQEKLKKLLNSDLLQHFLDVLVARRAIQVETAGLAAIKRTEEQVKKLEQLESQRLKDYNEKNISNPKLDIEIHRTIAEASKNEALIILSEMIVVLGQQCELFDEMRNNMDNPYFISHEKIIKAIKKGIRKDAEKAMLNHINSLIKDVEEFWEGHNV